ncbi:MAG: hypothetical protein Q4A11_01895 [Brachymonas sp.]|nr:hypothetical protein [Brachymonas sp.]
MEILSALFEANPELFLKHQHKIDMPTLPTVIGHAKTWRPCGFASPFLRQATIGIGDAYSLPPIAALARPAPSSSEIMAALFAPGFSVESLPALADAAASYGEL